MTDQEQFILDSLQRQYDALDAKRPAFLDPASGCSLVQKTQYADAVNQALVNLTDAQNALLGRDEAMIQQISVKVQKADQDIQSALTSLKDIAQRMDQMTNAVSNVTTVLKICVP